jgi:hypothetical protein
MLMIRRGLAFDDLRRQDLHVAGEHDQLDVGLIERREERPLLGCLVVGIDGKVQERHAEVLGDLAVVLVVRDDDGDVGREFAEADPCQEVEEAVPLLRHEQRNPRPLSRLDDLPRHAQRLGERRELDAESLVVGVVGERELDALQEQAVPVVGVLVGVGDVAPTFVDEAGGRGHQTGAVGAGEEEDGHPGFNRS